MSMLSTRSVGFKSVVTNLEKPAASPLAVFSARVLLGKREAFQLISRFERGQYIPAPHPLHILYTIRKDIINI